MCRTVASTCRRACLAGRGGTHERREVKAVGVYAWADLRRRWPSWLALTVVVALAAGAVLAMAAGARRTASAYPRFLRAVRAPDVRIFSPASQDQVDQLERLPEVREVATATGLAVADPNLGATALDDPRLGRAVSRFKFLAGRAPRADRPDEVQVSFLTAKNLHLRVGSRMTVHFTAGPNGSEVETVELRVVGIEATAGDFPPNGIFDADNGIGISPAFLATPAGAAAKGGPGPGFVEIAVRLRGGARGAPAFLADVARVSNGAVPAEALADQTAGVERSMRQQSVALWLMAAFVALAATLIVSQLLVRQVGANENDTAILQALGMTPWQVAVSALERVAALGVCASAAAVAVAFAVSPALPLGTARVAEPHPGLAFDATALGLGGAGVLAVLVVLGTVAARAVLRPAGVSSAAMVAGDSQAAPSSRWARLPLPLVVVTGVRMALERGRGRTAVPVRTTLTAAVTGLAAIATALTFGSSLDHLLVTPRLYGVSFDADIGAQGDVGDVRPMLPALVSDPTVEAIAIGSTANAMRSGTVSFGAQATTSVKGELDPTVISGRLPRAPGELLLGTQTARSLHARIGSTIPVSISALEGSLAFRVVGLGVLAPFSAAEQLGRGAVLTPDGLQRFTALAPPGFPPPPPGDVLVRFARGFSKTQAIASLSRRLGGPGQVSVFPAKQPADVASFGQVSNLPAILAGLLAALAAAATGHLLVTSVRRRRRDLAILKSLGLTGRQTAAVISWEACAVAVIAIVVGLPLGVAGGRWLWTLVAGQVGVVARPTVRWAVMATLVPAAALTAGLIATGPAIAAARVRAAVALRTE